MVEMHTLSSSPIQQNERISIVDVLRGFALSGVLLVNILCFIFKVLPNENIVAVTSWRSDIILHHFMSIFFYEKFITLFCILFGFGFGVLLQRLTAKGINSERFFIRRMFFLFLFGIVNISFMLGDILHQYAFCGIVLLLFRKTSTRNILITSCIFMFVGTGILRWINITFFSNVFKNWQLFATNYTATLKHGNIFDVMRMNWHGVFYTYYQNLFELKYASEIVGKFLLGYYILRMGYLNHLSNNIPFIKKVLLICLPFFLLHILIVYIVKIEDIVPHQIWFKTILYLVEDVTVLATTLFYLCAICLLYYRFHSAKVFSAFRYVGIMTLTNYLTQTVIYSLLFFGFGLGLLGEIHLTWLVVIAVITYFLQVVFSYYWLQYFRYGPMEWIWRQLCYGKILPIRKNLEFIER